MHAERNSNQECAQDGLTYGQRIFTITTAGRKTRHQACAFKPRVGMELPYGGDAKNLEMELNVNNKHEMKMRRNDVSTTVQLTI